MRSLSFMLTLALALGLGGALPTAALAQPAPPPPPPPAAPPPAPPPAAPPPATPPPAAKPLSEALTGMAKAEYEAGRILYADKDFANAIVKFQKAYELSNDPRLLFNVAVCQKNLRRYAKMLDTFRRYRKDGAALLTPEELAQATEIIKTVEMFVSALTLTANEDGADVFVDDEKMGTTPLKEPLFVDVGKRRIKVVKPGWKPQEVTREIPGGGTVSLDVALEKEIHRGRLEVASAGKEDIIAIDGSVVGRGRWDGTLPSGGHTLRVTAAGMATYQSEVVIQDNQLRHVDVTLNTAARTDTTKTVLWVIGGTALAAGAIVGGVFLFKPSTTTPVEGNIKPGTVQLSFHGFTFGGGVR